MELRFYHWHRLMSRYGVKREGLGNEIVLRTQNERRIVLDTIELGPAVYFDNEGLR